MNSVSLFTESLITPIKPPVCLDALLNLGKAEGSVDAGQMIKPALARGLQLVGATTRKTLIYTFRVHI